VVEGSKILVGDLAEGLSNERKYTMIHSSKDFITIVDIDHYKSIPQESWW
jgi:hypothetical protein